MSRMCRTVLPALALISIVFFSNTAVAGMVATPSPDAGRAAALETVQHRLAGAGIPAPSLEKVSTATLEALAAAPESGIRAGAAWLYVSIAAVLVALLVIAMVYYLS